MSSARWAALRPDFGVAAVFAVFAVFASQSAMGEETSASSVASPLKAVRSASGERAAGAFIAELNEDVFQTLRGMSAVRIEGFPLIGDVGDAAAKEKLVSVDLQLEALNVFAPGAKIVRGDVTQPGGIGEALPLPEVVFLRGSVEGEPDSNVFLGLSPHGTQGHVRIGSVTHIISTPPAHLNTLAGETMVYRADALPEESLALSEHFCGTGRLMQKLNKFAAPQQQPSGGVAGGDASCRVAQVAIETDYEFTGNVFGGDEGAAAAYASLLIAATSEIYLRDINTRLEIVFLRLWPTSNDPWTGSDMWAQLDQFLAYWMNNMGDQPRHVAHFLSGRALGGGLAYVGALCSEEFGYGISANLQGFFPYPVEDNHEQNWDIMVVAHELGHNFGAWHSHDYDPPIDTCGLGDCSTSHLGTIMSYCHQCDGGLANMTMELHPVIAAAVLNYLENDQDCLLEGSEIGATASDDVAVTVENEPVAIDVLANDFDSECGHMEILEFDSVSAMGGQILLDPGAGPNGRDLLTYEPPTSFSGEDSFAYTVIDGESNDSGAAVTVDVIPLRPADNPPAAEPMVEVAYYPLPDPQVLPDFAQFEPSSTELVPQINYSSTNGNFAGSGLVDNVGAVYAGLLKIETPGLYTLYTDSDDGSALYIGDEMIVNNDGLHGMLEKSGVIGLAAGLHEIRVEFFEHFGGAGLIVRWSGPGVAKQVIPASNWMHEVPYENPADLDGDGSVGVPDLLLLLGAWGECPPAPDDCAEDLNEDGSVGVPDLLLLLENWG